MALVLRDRLSVARGKGVDHGENQSAAALNKLWWIYGEDAFVQGPDGSWRASSELDSVIAALT